MLTYRTLLQSVKEMWVKSFLQTYTVYRERDRKRQRESEREEKNNESKNYFLLSVCDNKKTDILGGQMSSLNDFNSHLKGWRWSWFSSQQLRWGNTPWRRTANHGRKLMGYDHMLYFCFTQIQCIDSINMM